jgi:hypothetical protein
LKFFGSFSSCVAWRHTTKSNFVVCWDGSTRRPVALLWLGVGTRRLEHLPTKSWSCREGRSVRRKRPRGGGRRSGFSPCALVLAHDKVVDRLVLLFWRTAKEEIVVCFSFTVCFSRGARQRGSSSCAQRFAHDEDFGTERFAVFR